VTDLERIRKALKGKRLPDWVAKTHVELIEDAAGETAAVVHVVIREGRDAILRDGNALTEVGTIVHDALVRARIPLWPYVRFESESEAA
jgi:hypothetical protein